MKTSLLPLWLRQLACLPWTLACGLLAAAVVTLAHLVTPSFLPWVPVQGRPGSSLEFGLRTLTVLPWLHSVASHLSAFVPVSLCLESICIPCPSGKLVWPLYYPTGAPSLGSFASVSRAPAALSSASCWLVGAPRREHTVVYLFMQLILKGSESRVYLYNLSA